MSVQLAMAEVKRVAHLHCPRCEGGDLARYAEQARVPPTCEADIVAARALALAVHDEACPTCSDYAEGYQGRSPCSERAEIAGMA